ncbi:MAG: ExeM/NucH family extracellular endonuclease [Anaerolineae bacterium]|nr:ExeM/NucH family extracellular endonuclease [Anaerolineae bacterium]
MNFTTPEANDALGWQSVTRFTTLTGLTIANGDSFYLRWNGADVSGSGNRDEYGINNVQVAVSSGDTPPSVSVTNPTNGATGVAVDADIAITFSEDVNVTDPWFEIDCTVSGLVDATFTGTSPTNSYTLDPDEDFEPGELCTVTIFAAQVEDVDGTPDNMVADYVFNFTTAAAPTSNDLRISQVYGGGGNAGSVYTHDYIELFNAGTTTINLAGWSVQYGPMGNTTWSGRTNLSGDIAPGQYYLVQQASGGGSGSTPLPAPDAIGTINMAVGAGKVALVNSTMTLPDGCVHAAIVDLVGYGTAICYEGAAAAPGLSATNAGFRQQSGCQDTDQNGNDFFTAAAAPRNTHSLFYSCTGGDVPPAVINTIPTNGATNVLLDSPITITFSEDVNVTGTWFDITCTQSGNHPAVVTGTPPTNSYILTPTADFDPSETCTVTIFASQVTDIDGSPDNMWANYSFSFETVAGTIGSCGDGNELRIHTIQGSGLASPLVGTVQVIEGIVTADFQNTPSEMGGFFIQEEDAHADASAATSEGIYVFNNTFPVAVGDLVRIMGTVIEFNSDGALLTQISPATELIVCSSGNLLPTPVVVTMPMASVDAWEPYEGMLITIPQTLYVTEHFNLGRFGEVLLSANNIQYQFTHNNAPSVAGYASFLTNFALNTILLDDANTQQNRDPIVHPAPGLTAVNSLRIGDSVAALTGVLDQRFAQYRIQPVGTVTFTESNPRPAAPDDVDGTIWVASLNVLNYFSTIDTGTLICGPLANQGCRGADSADEFTRQRDKIIQAILALDADVIGLMEMENHASDAALDDLVAGLNVIAGTDTYTKISAFPLGSDAIKVAFIYRPARVTPIGLPLSDGSAIFDRPPLSQLFEVNVTGERFNVLVNHFKSKGCGGAAGADQDQLDGQGCFNDRRTQQAAQLLTFITGMIIPTTGDNDVLIIGDLNAYALEDPITTLASAGMTNLLSSYLGTTPFTYIFNGQAGYLDHALSSASLLPQLTGVTVWGINGDEPRTLDYNEEFKSPGQVISLYNADAYRSSDHSPILVGIYGYDFGDLDPSYGNAWHTGNGVLRLGTVWTADRTFAPGTDDGSDDGIQRISGSWTPGGNVTIRATVTRSSGADPAWLACWVDWNRDGSFDATGNELIINAPVIVGVNDIGVTIPVTATIGTDGLPARCRLYDSPTEPLVPLASMPTGAGVGGEVEDYVWFFTPTAITLQGMGVKGNAAAPILIALALILLVLGTAWGRRLVVNR